MTQINLKQLSCLLALVLLALSAAGATPAKPKETYIVVLKDQDVNGQKVVPESFCKQHGYAPKHVYQYLTPI